jgi:hypothetical protein
MRVVVAPGTQAGAGDHRCVALVESLRRHGHEAWLLHEGADDDALGVDAIVAADATAAVELARRHPHAPQAIVSLDEPIDIVALVAALGRLAPHAAGNGAPSEVDALRARFAALEAQCVETNRAYHDACGERDAQAAEARRLRHMLSDLTGTRRWRAVQVALIPADVVRRRRRLRPVTLAARVPVPFIVGVPRSGTTLLRLMLDAHPELAIGPETGFGLLTAAPDAPGMLAGMIGLETWGDSGLDRDAMLELLSTVDPWSTGDGLRAVYRAIAARDGKPRWGDKTPVHLMHMRAIADVLPEAHFIHIIRDGRDVAVSWRDLPFRPGTGRIEELADGWRRQIELGREQSRTLPHYLEVRYEDLVNEPERVLRQLCTFIDLDFASEMLRAHERAPRLIRAGPEVRRVGTTRITGSQRMAAMQRLAQPPDPSRARAWTQILSAGEVEQFEAIAGGLLDELGYR